jgi:phage-related protein
MDDDEDIIEIPLRPLVWMGDSLKNIRSFPEEVRASVGYALQLVQAGETPMDAKPFKGVGVTYMKLSNATILILTGQSMQ